MMSRKTNPKIKAILGPTNTGKTHQAINMMLGYDTGMIGVPLRLLARELYDKISSKIGAQSVALITGEENIYQNFQNIIYAQLKQCQQIYLLSLLQLTRYNSQMILSAGMYLQREYLKRGGQLRLYF